MDDTKTADPVTKARAKAARALASSRGLDWKTLSKDERKALKKETGAAPDD
jgi:hypothetical protein